MIFYAVGAILELVVSVSGLHVGTAKANERRHARCLANTELLEIQLGIREPVSSPSDRAYSVIARAKAANYTARQVIEQTSPRNREIEEQLAAHRKWARDLARYYGWKS